MADGIYYHDTRQPVIVADETGITLTTTAKALWPVARTILPANYWTIGKTVKLEAFLKWTTGTAGNITWSMAYGAGDNPGVIVSTTAVAKVASVGPFGVYIQGFATCRQIGAGTTATLSMWGMVYAALGAELSTVQPQVFPNNGTTVVSGFDSTVGTNALTFQATMSAGTDTVVTTALLMTAMN
jgi:hypothetical protein